MIVKSLTEGNLIRAGEERRDEWEDGWRENLGFLRTGQDISEAIIPKYFNKYNVVRWDRRFIQPISENFERSSLAIIVDYIADTYFRHFSSIYEFGCGTGHNLFSMRSVNTTAKLHGLDWATSSQEIIESMRSYGVDGNIFGINFDYFHPNLELNLEGEAGVFTVASLEQIGKRWDKFIDFLIIKKPQICVHIEPVSELLDENVLLDYMSIEYFKKRNYLSGFLAGLREFEKMNRIEIIDERRTYIGSLFIEGYSIVVWRPL